jgi:hypothetical protein
MWSRSALGGGVKIEPAGSRNPGNWKGQLLLSPLLLLPPRPRDAAIEDVGVVAIDKFSADGDGDDMGYR